MLLTLCSRAMVDIAPPYISLTLLQTSTTIQRFQKDLLYSTVTPIQKMQYYSGSSRTSNWHVTLRKRFIVLQQRNCVEWHGSTSLRKPVIHFQFPILFVLACNTYYRYLPYCTYRYYSTRLTKRSGTQRIGSYRCHEELVPLFRHKRISSSLVYRSKYVIFSLFEAQKGTRSINNIIMLYFCTDDWNWLILLHPTGNCHPKLLFEVLIPFL